MQARGGDMRSDREIGARLRILRGDLTQKQVLRRLAKLRVKLPELAITRIENGQRALKFSEAMGLAVVYDIPLERIASDSGRDVDDRADEADRRMLDELRALVSHIESRIDVVERRLQNRAR
jgi:transcriptional regulator with XRE-family HTH domain